MAAAVGLFFSFGGVLGVVRGLLDSEPAEGLAGIGTLLCASFFLYLARKGRVPSRLRGFFV
jgi:hypothetical protein